MKDWIPAYVGMTGRMDYGIQTMRQCADIKTNKDVGVKVLFLVVLFYFPNSLLAEELKDPWTRDEDISNTIVSVDVSRNSNGFYEYVYSIKSDIANRGKITTFDLNLSCDYGFGDIEKPLQKDEPGFIDLSEVPSIKGLFDKKRTPASISAERGNAADWSFDIYNYATWGVAQYPGDKRVGLKLVSPASPGLRLYKLVPYLEVYGWDYPEEEDPDMPWVDDFTVTGIIAGPGCPGQTPPVDAAFFPGSRGEAEPDSVNALLTYSEPLLDRWHADESIKELTITVHYADTIDPASFQVKPDWAREFFKPIPGTSQSVVLPLKQMRNRFKLMVDIDRAKVPKDFGEVFQDTDAFEVRRDLIRGK